MSEKLTREQTQMPAAENEEAEAERPNYWESRDALMQAVGTAKAGMPEEQFQELEQRLSEVLSVGDEAVRSVEAHRDLPIDQGGEMGKAGWGDH